MSHHQKYEAMYVAWYTGVGKFEDGVHGVRLHFPSGNSERVDADFVQWLALNYRMLTAAYQAQESQKP